MITLTLVCLLNFAPVSNDCGAVEQRCIDGRDSHKAACKEAKRCYAKGMR